MSTTFHGGSSSTGWKAIPAKLSVYEVIRFPDRYRSADRFRLVRAQCTTFSAVIAAEEHCYQINLDYFNAQKIMNFMFVEYVVLNSQKHHGEMMVRHQHTIYVIAVGLNLVGEDSTVQSIKI